MIGSSKSLDKSNAGGAEVVRRSNGSFINSQIFFCSTCDQGDTDRTIGAQCLQLDIYLGVLPRTILITTPEYLFNQKDYDAGFIKPSAYGLNPLGARMDLTDREKTLLIFSGLWLLERTWVDSKDLCRKHERIFLLGVQWYVLPLNSNPYTIPLQACTGRIDVFPVDFVLVALSR